MRRANQHSLWPGVSYYEHELGTERSPHVPPSQPQHHRIVIIGGGLAGLSTAWSLVERGITDIAICEAHQPGHGASGRNGGFVFAGYSLPNQALVKQAGQDAGRALHRWTREAVGLVRQRIDQLDIDCQANDAGVLLADWFSDDRALRAFQHRMAEDLDFQLEWVDQATCQQWIASKRYGAALHEPGSFHFHPLRYVQGLIQALQQAGVSIYGQTPVQRLQPMAKTSANPCGGWRLHTEPTTLSCEQVVLATGGYDTRLWPRLGRSIQPIATYIATTPPLGQAIHALIPQQHAIYDTRFAFDYYRPLPDQRLLWGGRISIQARSPDQIKQVLKRDLMKVFPQLESVDFDHAWGGWMGYTRHKMPLLGQDSSGLWHATGFGGHGMAPTTLGGEIIAEAILGDRTRLNAYQQWQPAWAGGTMGRVWAQATYWALNFQDARRDRLATRRGQHA